MKLSFQDIENLSRVHNAKISTWLEDYKNYMMYVMDRQVELDKSEDTRWMSNVKSNVTYSITNALYGYYLDNQATFQVNRTDRVEFDENLSDEQIDKEVKRRDMVGQSILDLLDHQYSISGAREEMDRVALDSILLWTWFGKIHYKKSKNKVEYMSRKNWQNKTYEEVIDIPTVEHINPLNLLIDPSWDVYTGKYVIYRKTMSKSNIKDYYKVYWYEASVTEKDNKYIWTKDWDMVVRQMMFMNKPWIAYSWLIWWWVGNVWGRSYWADNLQDWFIHSDIINDNSFEIGDDLCEVFEVWTDNTIQLFVNGKDFWIRKSLSPRKVKPFFEIKFKTWLDRQHWIWVWYITYNYQKIIDSFLNMRIDADRIKAAQPFLISTEETAFDGTNSLVMRPWQTIKMKDIEKGITPMPMIEWGWVANNEVMMMTQQMNDIFWLNNYATGQQWGGIERSAKWVQELVQSTIRAFKDFMISYWRAMAFIAKYSVIMAYNNMDEETLKNITWNNLIQNFDLDVLLRDYRISFDLQSQKNLQDQILSQQLLQVISNVWALQRPDWTQILDVEEAARLYVESLWLPEWVVLTSQEAQDYMEKQIEISAKLQKKEQDLLGQAWVMTWQEWQEWQEWQGQINPVNMPWWIPWVQWGGQPWITRDEVKWGGQPWTTRDEVKWDL